VFSLVQFLKTCYASVFFWERRALARPPRPRWSVALPGGHKGAALDHWWTAPQHHDGFEQMLRNQTIADVERLDKALETVAAAVHQLACLLEVLLQQDFFDGSLLVFQENAQELCGNSRIIG
jgi:hypothetical protein